jgi:hypothetical protein
LTLKTTCQPTHFAINQPFFHFIVTKAFPIFAKSQNPKPLSPVNHKAF